MKYIPHVVWLIGVVVILVALGRYSGSSMPYQDPTPALLAVQSAQVESSEVLTMIGGSIFIAGVAWAMIRRRSGRTDSKP